MSGGGFTVNGTPPTRRKASTRRRDDPRRWRQHDDGNVARPRHDCGCGTDGGGRGGQRHRRHPINAPVATFTDANPDGTLADFTAGTTINWGDGTALDGTVRRERRGLCRRGTHTYAEEGPTRRYTIVDDGGQTATATSSNSATIAAAPLTGSGVTENGTQDVSLTAPVATFTDANPDGSVSNFTATVIWGDGTAATSATITESGGVFTVTGTHTYTVQGTYMPTVSIVDDGGSTATVTDTFDIVHAPPTVTAGGTATYIGAGAVTLDAGVTVSDPDSGGDLAGATVTISTGFIAGDTLEIGGQTSGTITDTGGTINYAFTGSTLSLSGPRHAGGLPGRAGTRSPTASPQAMVTPPKAAPTPREPSAGRSTTALRATARAPPPARSWCPPRLW